ncbi:formate dehydrogenase accessory sulfurtransferase FdhD [Fredinandcohnia quinoae]|uniref:Sulfur carrier protein FdhD n=1 Tax=Fredinandcohnia quinoae TaxID=2918902 RepID=A0AAW5E1W5_9BACI|nr:formate dehydrogenase accessory sulfurtransferase FdhD [Fredinandcohnia sp. SECRCQ15]MCH1623991.1 formate dehydrogenase accessory sulfurtransferase FdhD [Fredinandcohnia sp. SECRCQ15]
MNDLTTITKNIVKYHFGQFVEEEDQIVTEFPLTIILNNKEFATLVCSPSELDELVVGFLASEGVIRFYDEIINLQIDVDQGFAYVTISKQVNTNQEYYSKRFIGSCCGKGRQFYFVNDTKTAKTSTSNLTLTPEECMFLMDQLQQHSVIFKDTGGVHNASLCSGSEVMFNRSDIGRHNALDKIYGHCLINKIPVRDKIIVFSGRISSEVLLKAAKIGVGVVLSKSAPTDLAIKMAEELNITAVGFIRGETLNVYSCPERIIQKSVKST